MARYSLRFCLVGLIAVVALFGFLGLSSVRVTAGDPSSGPAAAALVWMDAGSRFGAGPQAPATASTAQRPSLGPPSMCS